MLTGANSLLVTVVEWDVFGTLTFRAEPSWDTAVRQGLDWLLRVRVLQRLSESEHYWLLRPERGEHGGRVHLHVLLRVKPASRGLFVVPRGLSMAHRLWNRGMTKFRFVEGRSDAAVVYLQKVCEQASGADTYELSKTSRNLYLYPSSALLKRADSQKSKAGGSPVATEPLISTLAECSAEA